MVVNPCRPVSGDDLPEFSFSIPPSDLCVAVRCHRIGANPAAIFIDLETGCRPFSYSKWNKELPFWFSVSQANHSYIVFLGTKKPGSQSEIPAWFLCLRSRRALARLAAVLHQPKGHSLAHPTRHQSQAAQGRIDRHAASGALEL